MEATTSPEHFDDNGPPLGGSATMRAATRVNAEQASKRRMRKPTPPASRGRLPRAGKRATGAPARFRRGIGGGTHVKRGMDATREAPPVAWHAPTDSP